MVTSTTPYSLHEQCQFYFYTKGHVLVNSTSLPKTRTCTVQQNNNKNSNNRLWIIRTSEVKCCDSLRYTAKTRQFRFLKGTNRSFVSRLLAKITDKSESSNIFTLLQSYSLWSCFSALLVSVSGLSPRS